MKWESAPLGLIVVPLIIGFLIACVLGLIQDSSSLRYPMIFLLLSSILLYFAPQEIGNRKELIAGSMVSILVGILPQLIFFVWFIIVILIWLSQTAYIWRHNSPSFRIGVWAGLGGCSGLYIGSFFAHYVLIN
jgi:hypothetical protein